MAYTKTDWQTALITADNFNKLQTQYAEAVADAIGIRANGTAELRAEVVADFPAHSAGRIIYHTGKKMFFYSNGQEWLLDPKETFWGDAQNGVFSSTGSVTFSNSLGATVIRNYRNFTLNPGHTITTQAGCRCLVIRSWGDIVIEGTVDLDGKGGFGDRYITIGGVQYDMLGGLGGDGGAGSQNGNGGTTDSGLRSAGGMRGGGGGGGFGGVAGTGGRKNTPFDLTGGYSPGSYQFGGQSAYVPTTINGENGAGGGGGGDNFGGGTNTVAQGGGGRQTPKGVPAGGGGGGCSITYATGTFNAYGGEPGATAQNGSGGGALVLLAMGDITINGQVRCRGSNGGNGGNAYNGSYLWDCGGGGGGGGSGGGTVVVIRRGNYNFAGQYLLTGGTGGTGGIGRPTSFVGPGFAGTTGSTGTVSTYSL